MAAITDQDRYFSSQIEASIPRHLIPEGSISRLINGRFIEGAITNAIGFDEIKFTYLPTKRQNSTGETLFASPVKYQDLLERGDVQLVAPLDNIVGQFLIAVISGRLFRLDLDELTAVDITPVDAFLPPNSSVHQLSFTDNDGGVYGVGGYLVIFNYPNRSILIGPTGARLANPGLYEVPPTRMGATAGSRLAAISGDNLLYVSDPLGGANSLAPLTFEETLRPGADYYQQIFNIGSILDLDYVTAVCRLSSYASASQDFLAKQILISTTKKKFIVSVGAVREAWDQIEFISYLGSSDGIAGPLSYCTVGNNLFYISTQGRIKTLSQDEQRDVGLQESFLDDPLGQYLSQDETSFYHRLWYKTLDHSRGLMKFNQDRVYATVYPISVPAISSQGDDILSPSHRALAIASLDSTTKLGPVASITWEGFYDWVNPIGVVTLKDDLYVVSKDQYGNIKYYKENFTKTDEHNTIIYTRGYFASFPGVGKSMLEGYLYFRKLAGPVDIEISYLIDNKWVLGASCTVQDKLHKFSFRTTRCSTEAASISLKIEIIHNGCQFELESIRASGEARKEEKK